MVGVTSDKTNPSNPLVFNTSETEMIKSLLECDMLSDEIASTSNNTFVGTLLFFNRAIDAKVAEKKKMT